MTVEHTGVYFQYLSSLGVGGMAGIACGYLVKKLLKIGLIVIGVFFAALGYLSSKGIVNVNWDAMSNYTQTTMTNLATQASTIANHTAEQLQRHGAAGVSLINGLPMAAGLGFLPGMYLGWKWA